MAHTVGEREVVFVFLTQVQQLLQQELLLQEEDFRGVLWVYDLIGAVTSKNGFIVGCRRHQGEGQHEQADGLKKLQTDLICLVEMWLR